MNEYARHFGEISEQIKSQNAILFLGSGSTLFCKKPDGKRGLTGKGLAKEVLREINNGIDPGFEASLMEAAEYYTSVKASGRKGLDLFIQSRLRDLQPTIGHYIVSIFPWRAVITTNFNEVTENAWRAGNSEGFAKSEIVPITIDSDLQKYSGDHSRTRFYKPHGCITVHQQQDNRMVLTSSDFSVSEKIRKNIYEEIRYFVRNCTTVFVGYSLTDFTFRNILYKLHEEMGEWTSQCYSVSPVENPLQFEWMSQAMKDNFKTTLINLSFDSFMLRLLKQSKALHPALKSRVLASWDDTYSDNISWMDGLRLSNFESLPSA